MLGSPLAQSQRDRKIPYTLEGHVDRLRGQGSEPVDWSFFSGIVCGIVRMMIGNGHEPHGVRLFGA